MIDKLMIVSHPDDEILFGGNELITHNGEYKVVCIDYGDDPIRSKEFKKVMELAGVIEYEHLYGYKGGEDYIRRHLLDYMRKLLIYEKDWKKIVTHNEVGEYKHPRHIALHDIVVGILRGYGRDREWNLWVFGKGKISLSEKQVKEKQKLLDIYKSQQVVLNWFSPRYEKLVKFDL
jgi:LmbE family N-acetylglucosaminyl deacetylase